MKTRFGRYLGLGLVLWTILAVDAIAGDIPGYPDTVLSFDAREVAMLPAYCTYTQVFRQQVPGGNNPAEIKRWTAAMGPTFEAMHHYCWGLMKTNRALLLAKVGRIRSFYLGSAIEEFDYVLTRAPADFVMLPEILTKKGQNLLLLGRDALGVKQLERAIELKPDYWPPYADLSDYNRKKGDLVAARALLEKALALAPDAKGIKLRLDELDSAAAKKKPDPRPSARSN